MNFNIISVMPDLIKEGLNYGVIGSAFKKGLSEVKVVNPREFAVDNHQSIDDRPFGGGDGMLMMAEPLQKALESFSVTENIFYLSPQGSKLTDSMARSLSEQKEVTLICGRYGGVDQRFLVKNNIQEISIGDYVLSGGELACLVVIDATLRHCPGVLGHTSSADEDSFSNGLLEAPYFTRPQNWLGYDTPPVLLSGDHKKISEFRKQMSRVVTLLKRPDLFSLQESSSQMKKDDWLNCYKYVEKMETSELTFFIENKDQILQLIKRKINE